MSEKFVVVVGAGLSGLAAVKACLEECLDVVCYEKSNDVGGCWNYSDTEFSCSKNTVLNVSKEIMAYSDFPFPDEIPNFVNDRQYLNYLKDYAAHFDLNDYIKLEHAVICIEKGPQYDSIGNWKITVKDVAGDMTKEVIASHVIVCSGVYGIPHYDTYPGLEDFKGSITHSTQYKTADQFANKNVLVVGSGNWAYDIAVEVGNVAKKVNCISNVGLLIISRMGIKGYPYDIAGINRFHVMKWVHWSTADGIARDFRKMCTPGVDLEAYGLPLTNYNPAAHVICINDQLPYSILTGRVEMHSPIERFTSSGVFFRGKDKEYPLDAVILATGFDKPNLKLLFPNEEISAQDYGVGFYKSVFPLHLKHQTVAFICAGHFNFSFGCTSDLQSRWVAAVFSQRVSLPPKHVQEKENNKDLTIQGARPGSNRLPLIQNLPIYCDRVAELLGVKPNLPHLFFTDHKLFKALMFGPMVPYQYRLNGIHSWVKARQTILTTLQRVRAGFGSRPA